MRLGKGLEPANVFDGTDAPGGDDETFYRCAQRLNGPVVWSRQRAVGRDISEDNMPCAELFDLLRKIDG